MENNKLTIEWEVGVNKTLEEYMQTAATTALAYENITFPCQIEALIVDEDTIREMNKEYRNIDRVTDVLSFPLYENPQEAAEDVMDDEPVILGNMVICLPRAEQQAEEYGHSLQREICFLTVHSVLHLLGYDHELGDREESEMFCKQHEILENMGVSRK